MGIKEIFRRWDEWQARRRGCDFCDRKGNTPIMILGCRRFRWRRTIRDGIRYSWAPDIPAQEPARAAVAFEDIPFGLGLDRQITGALPPDGPGPVDDQVIKRDWIACMDCAPLVQARDWEAVADRHRHADLLGRAEREEFIGMWKAFAYFADGITVQFP